MKKEKETNLTMTNIFIGLLVFIIILVVLISILQVMGDRIKEECNKQGNLGIIHYWDSDIDCSQYYQDYMEVENKWIQTYDKCCNGNYCTDTYYTPEDNLCHLSLCENSWFTNKKDCIYEGKK